MNSKTYPIPEFYDPDQVGKVWRVPYQERAEQAAAWREEHAISPFSQDDFTIALVLVDVQNTFCTPGYGLFVGGRSGNGAVGDSKRLSRFIYNNLGRITHITATLDTHQAFQIFHSAFIINDQGEHPPANTQIRVEDIQSGKWKANPKAAATLGVSQEYAQKHLEYYVRTLAEREKFDLTVWPYHAMLGGIGHALVSSIEEAVFFHTLARNSQPHLEIKGWHPFTEHYSAMKPEVQEDMEGRQLGEFNTDLLESLLEYDAIIIAGQAKSHCVNWTVGDILEKIQQRDPALASKFYLLEDCTSPVVIPDVVDFTDVADAAFARYTEAGMHLVRSTEPMEDWEGMGS